MIQYNDISKIPKQDIFHEEKYQAKLESQPEIVEKPKLSVTRSMRDKKVKNPREDRPLSREMTQALRKTEWLSDDHIDGGLVLLRKLNKDVGGLFNIGNGLTAYPKADGDQWI